MIIIRNIVRGIGLSFRNDFMFCSQGSVKISADDKMASFYRNTIRQANLDSKGRGKFSQHQLIKLIKLTTQQQQVPLLLEAYYNFLGHFTLMSNTTVDKMIIKILSLPSPSLDSIYQIYVNHCYLHYFPHYSVTSALINVASNESESFLKLLKILRQSPLLKINIQITQNLLQIIKKQQNPAVCSGIIKLLISRYNFNVIKNIITGKELLNSIVQSLEITIDQNRYQTMGPNGCISQFITKIKQQQPLSDDLHFQLAILAISFRNYQKFSDQLILIKNQDKLIRALLYLEQVREDLMKNTMQYLNTLQLSSDLKARLVQFQGKKQENPSQTQSQ